MRYVIRAAIVVTLTTMMAGPGRAQGTCVLGNESWIEGCTASCKASWSGSSARRCADSCTASAPPGTVIVNHRTQPISVSNGGHSASRVAAGQTFDYRSHVEDSYNAAIDAAARAGEQRYEAALREAQRAAVRQTEQFQSSHQAVRLSVNARAHGSPIDRKRGWSNYRVDLLVRCVAPADLVGQLTARRQQPSPVLPPRS